MEHDFERTVSQLKQTATVQFQSHSSSTSATTLKTVPWLETSKTVDEAKTEETDPTSSYEDLKVNGEADDTKMTTAQAKTIYQKFWQVFKGINDVMYQDYRTVAKVINSSSLFKQQYQKVVTTKSISTPAIICGVLVQDLLWRTAS